MAKKLNIADVTPGSEWRAPRETGSVERLPSGRVALLRPVIVEDLILLGHIPDALTAFVNAMLLRDFGQPDAALQRATESDPVKTARELLEFQRLVCSAAFVTPKVVETPQADDEITFTDIAPEDREWVVGWAQSAQARLASFRR